jgi:hypothetical protein
MADKHTPLPWESLPVTYFSVNSNGDEIWLKMFSVKPELASSLQKAVNSHHRLKAENERLRELVNMGLDAIEALYDGDPTDIALYGEIIHGLKEESE